MDSPVSLESSPATRSLNSAEITPVKRRGRPPGSSAKARVVSDSQIVKSRTRQTPSQRRTRQVYNASPPVQRALLSNKEHQESPPTSPGEESAAESTAGDTTSVADSFMDDGLESTTPETALSPSLARSSASAPEVPQALQAQRQDAAALERPKGPRKTKSEPSSRPQPTTAYQVDSKIMERLRMPLTKTEVKKEKVGNNYVFEVVTTSSAGETVVKVGYTGGPEQKRLQKIDCDCQHVQIVHHEDPEQIPIRLYKRAEKLAQKELAAFLYPFSCQCRTEHREYFTVDPKVARDAVRRWREFCRQEPYDKEGRLRAFWEHRILNMQRCGESETIHDHEKRAERWRKFMSPTDLEKIRFDFVQLQAKLWNFRWQGLAIVESIVIVLLTFPSIWAVFHLVGIFSLVTIELLQLELPLVLEVVQERIKGYKKGSSHSASS